MGCVFGREISSSSGTVSESKRRDISVESTTRKVDEDSVEKVENNNGVEILDGGTQAQKEKKGDGVQTQRPPKGERRRSKPNQRLSNVPKHSRGEQAAAGWPAWLTDTCGEALSGWIPRRADTFEKIDKIGSGTYSNVYKAKDMLTGKIVALKKVRFDNLEPESVKFMAREILLLRRLNHPNVVKLEGLVTSRMSCSLYLVFEYMEHDLAGLAASPEIKFTEAQVKCYMHQLLSGLEHCHNRHVLHRDIKGSNLLIDNEGVLRIADFGLASFFDPNHKHPMTSRVVTLWYRPPELLLGATDYGVGVDLWSAGCILAELLAGKPIMPGRTEVEQLHKIYKLCGSPSDEYWKKAKLPNATLFKPREPYRRCIKETFKDFPPSSLPLIETLLAIDPAERKTATDALRSEIKGGDVRFLANTSFLLVKKDWSSEIRLHAFKMLQHLVRLRWEELSSEEHRNFANVALELMSDMANPCEEWALKSQTAALVAEIVRREVLLWQELFPSLVPISSQGPIQAELVSMMLRWLPEDITVHNEDLEGDRRRLLLRGLTLSLPEILPLLYTLLERHFGAALNEAGKQQLDIAKQHAATVTATLNAINAYAEWAPLPDLAKYGIIHGCGFLLSSPDFRLHACEFFKLVSPRKRPSDDSASEFNSAMTSIFHMLMNVAKEFLYRSASNAGAVEESEIEFVEYICESMVSLGSSNLQCISGDITVLPLYLEQMLGLFQHFKLALHYQSLLFWLALMRDLMSKSKTVVHSSGEGLAVKVSFGPTQVDNEKLKILSLVNDGICSAILDTSFQRVLKKEKVPRGMALSLGSLELWSDDVEGKGDFGQYRSKLLELIKFIASYKPLIAGAKVCERIDAIVKSLLLSSNSQELAVMESMQLALENVVSTIFDGSNEVVGGSSEVQLALGKTFEGLLQQLLSLKWTEPAFVEVLGHYLEALGPFLKYFPDAVGSVINKLFELLTSLPFIVKDPSTNSARHARLQICTSFIRIAKAADKSVLPHMKGIADTMAYLQREGCLLRGEHNLLGEAFLVMASSAGVQQQQEVLAWLLEPLSQQWMQQEWQNNYLSEPLGLVQLCFETPTMWSIFHTVTFFEKALKRSGTRKPQANLQNSSRATSTHLHPMASHLSWMLPPLLKLLRAIHSLWSPSISQNLPVEVKAAMMMSDVERYSLLGEGNPKLSKAALTFTDGSQISMSKEGITEPNETNIRNWLKGIRDSGYNVLGLSTTIGDSFFKCLDIHSIALALVENIQSMEFRHLRQLIHSVFIPLVKNCPQEVWDIWLEKLLHPLFLHSQQALSCSWSGLLHEGRAKVPDAHGIFAGSDLKVEVIEEKLLRDLTREVCALLAVIASPQLNTGLPSLEHSGHVTRVDLSALKDLDAFASGSMVGFLLKHKGLALPALQICLEAFAWTDGEAVTKVSSFCAALVVLAVVTNNVELREFVAKDLFSAIIHGLALESNAVISADLVGLSREIFIHLCERDPAPRQVLLSLPSITHNDLRAFEEALTKTSSSKEQKQHMKSLLLLATGNKLRALAAQKSVNVITNVTARPRGTVNAPAETRADDGETVGLAAIL